MKLSFGSFVFVWCATVGVLRAQEPAKAELPATDANAAARAEEEASEEDIILPPEAFDEALADFHEGDYAEAAGGFWRVIDVGGEENENFAWAQFFLAQSLERLGLIHGAVGYYVEVAKTRTRPEIVPDALQRLESITRSHPHNVSRVEKELIYDAEFFQVSKSLQSWTRYVQGLHDYRNGFTRWASGHFSEIPESSPYHADSLYVEAVHHLKHDRDDQAMAQLNKILSSEPITDVVRNKAHLALARLYFDQENYPKAEEHYAKVKQIELSFEQAELLNEKAWTAYSQGKVRRAMGLLQALDAPSYRKYFLPDTFLLRGLILKQLCHYLAAKSVVRDFRRTYRRTLDALRARVPMKEIAVIRHAAAQSGRLESRTQFIRALRKEREKIEDHDGDWEDAGLDTHLRRLYGLELSEQMRLWTIAFERRADAIADRLLEANEEMDLLDYEVGLDIFRRLKKSDATGSSTQSSSSQIPYDSANVYYEFAGEYWNDELHSYQYFIVNRCFEGEASE